MREEQGAGTSGEASELEINGSYARYVLVVLIIVYIFNFIDRNIFIAEFLHAVDAQQNVQLRMLLPECHQIPVVA